MQKIITTAMLSFGIMALAQTGNVEITLPNTIADGFSCIIVQEGAGEVNITGTNVKGANGLKINKQYSAIGIVVRNGIATVTGDTKN